MAVSVRHSIKRAHRFIDLQTLYFPDDSLNRAFRPQKHRFKTEKKALLLTQAHTNFASSLVCPPVLCLGMKMEYQIYTANGNNVRKY